MDEISALLVVLYVFLYLVLLIVFFVLLADIRKKSAETASHTKEMPGILKSQYSTGTGDEDTVPDYMKKFNERQNKEE